MANCVQTDDKSVDLADQGRREWGVATEHRHSDGGGRVGILTAAQASVLEEIAAEIAVNADEAVVGRGLVRAAAVIDAAAAVFVNRDGSWVPCGRPVDVSLAAMRPALDTTTGLDAATTRVIGGHTWTLVPNRVAAPIAVIFVEGDWTLSPAPFIALADAVARHMTTALPVSDPEAFHHPTVTARTIADRRARLHFRMVRQLGRTVGLPQVAKVVLRYAAAAIDAETAALALVSPGAQDARILATRGYPLALVEDVRIEPGSGVIGNVINSRRPILADDTTVGHKPRLRYRTHSYVVAPLLSGSNAIGALCATDAAGGRAFTAEDLAVLRMFAASAVPAIDREHARAAAEISAHVAAIDPVTGVFNRRYLQVRLEEELQRARRHDMPVAVLVIDIDDFKIVNDSYGHLVGDAALKNIADILRHSVRVFDVCARFGGDEFVIVMPGSSGKSATRIAERIRTGIEQHRSTERALARVRMTVSIGVALSSREMSAKEALDRADQALYAAKHSGKNQVRGDVTGE